MISTTYVPRLMGYDTTYGSVFDTERDRGLQSGNALSNHGADIGDLLDGQFLAARPVFELIGAVLGLGFPGEVVRRDASFMTATARMRGLMARCRRFAMGGYADQSRNGDVLSTNIELAVPFARSSKRPNETIVSIIGKGRFYEASRLASIGRTPGRRSMSLVSIVVRVAKPGAMNKSATAIDRAFDLAPWFRLLKRSVSFEAPEVFVTQAMSSGGIGAIRDRTIHRRIMRCGG